MSGLVSLSDHPKRVVSDDRFGLLMSIQPRFADAILAGTKTVELRRKPPRDGADVVIIYGSGSARAVLGVAQLKHVHTSTPDDIWKRFGRTSGVTREEFDEYFAGSETASALELASPRRSVQAVSLGRLREFGLEPPQSWRYVERSLATALLKALDLEPASRRIGHRFAKPPTFLTQMILMDLGLIGGTSRLSAPVRRIADSVRCVGSNGFAVPALPVRGRRAKGHAVDIN